METHYVYWKNPLLLRQMAMASIAMWVITRGYHVGWPKPWMVSKLLQPVAKSPQIGAGFCHNHNHPFMHSHSLLLRNWLQSTNSICAILAQRRDSIQPIQPFFTCDQQILGNHWEARVSKRGTLRRAAFCNSTAPWYGQFPRIATCSSHSTWRNHGCGAHEGVWTNLAPQDKDSEAQRQHGNPFQHLPSHVYLFGGAHPRFFGGNWSDLWNSNLLNWPPSMWNSDI